MRYEFNRPFLEAKAYQEDDALAVEATGYALLTMFRVEGGGVTVDQVRKRGIICRFIAVSKRRLIKEGNFPCR